MKTKKDVTPEIATRYTATGRDPKVYNCPACDGMGFLPGGVFKREDMRRNARKKDERCPKCGGTGRKFKFKIKMSPMYDQFIPGDKNLPFFKKGSFHKLCPKGYGRRLSDPLYDNEKAEAKR